MRALRHVLLTLLVVVVVAGIAVYAFARSGGLSAERKPGALEEFTSMPSWREMHTDEEL